MRQRENKWPLQISSCSPTNKNRNTEGQPTSKSGRREGLTSHPHKKGRKKTVELFGKSGSEMPQFHMPPNTLTVSQISYSNLFHWNWTKIITYYKSKCKSTLWFNYSVGMCTLSSDLSDNVHHFLQLLEPHQSFLSFWDFLKSTIVWLFYDQVCCCANIGPLEAVLSL